MSEEGLAQQSRREQILTAVWTVIAAQGVSAVSFRSVAATAEVSLGSVQHYFSSKRELISASAQHMIDAAEALHASDTRASSPEAELRALLSHAIPRAEQSPAGTAVFYSFVAASVSYPEVAAVLAEAKRDAHHRATELLTMIQPGVQDAAQRAHELIALTDGLAMRVLIGALDAVEASTSLRRAINQCLG